MKFLRLKINQDIFKFNEIKFTNDLILSEESKSSLIEYLTPFVEVIEVKSDKEFISVISEQLDINNTTNIGNTIDIHTTNKRIYQMCYLESKFEVSDAVGVVDDDVGAVEVSDGVKAVEISEGVKAVEISEGVKAVEISEGVKAVEISNLNFLATVCNIKRKPINGDVFIFGNSLLTTKISDAAKTLEYISQTDITIDDLIEIILSNYYFTGVCFEGNEFKKFLFNNNMTIIAPESLKDITLAKLSFIRKDVLNFTIDVFYDNEGTKSRNKYNSSLGLFYDVVFNNRIFISLRSETEKNYDSLLSEYISKLISIYNKFLVDDKELMIPKELKFYDYQSNEKYTNKYIIFDNLFDKII